MRARLGLLGLFAGAAALALSGCGLSKPNSFRYRMTVEVETSQGLVSGSAVREVTFAKRASGGDYARARGEAVAVDLPGGRTLFALLRGAGGNVDHAGQDVWHLFRQADADMVELWPKAPPVSSPRVPYSAPMLVTFADIADPTSVRQVDPANLATALGDGVRLHRITVEMTGEPVTLEVRSRLGWLAEVGRNRASLRTDVPKYLDETEPVQLVSPGDFSKDLYK